jgi:hypothetical protein
LMDLEINPTLKMSNISGKIVKILKFIT